MKLDTLSFNDGQWSVARDNIGDKSSASVILLFGDSDILREAECCESLARLYPRAEVVGASSSGNILGAEISNAPLVAVAVELEKGHTKVAAVDFAPQDDVETLARKLVDQFPREDLRHLFVISDGINVNGSDLVRGINRVGIDISVSGGMAGDGERFSETWVVANGSARQHRIAAVGFYGSSLVVSTGCFAGWSPFGAERHVTRSEGNVLYELDGKPALDLYKEYLGDYASDLPSSGMRFPLAIRHADEAEEIIRTLLGIDEEQRSITFAGDIPEGDVARLMKPDIDALIDGAGQAARAIDMVNSDTALGLVVSCVGRRVIMKQMVEEELEEIEDVLGANVQLTGFYSYGEIAPLPGSLRQCRLHNQTMTLTAVYER